MASNVPLRILVVDDEAELLQITVETLNLMSYEARGASSAQEALQILKADHFDLILCDICMPQVSGIEFYEQVKVALPVHPPILFSSGLLQLPSQMSLPSGALGLIQKPFSVSALHEKLQGLGNRT